MSEVTIRFNFDTGGINTVDDMIDKLRELDDVGKSSGGSSGGIGSLASGWSTLASGVTSFAGTAGKVIDVISDLNDAGTKALRVQSAFDGLAGGKADEYLSRMMTATRGLINDTGLMTAATHALSSGAAKTAEDLQRMTEIGATLGVTFAGSAENGVNKIEKALVAVGNYRGLRDLGFDIDEVKKKFADYQTTMSKSDAWRMAVLDEGIATANKFPDALTGAGTAVERFGVKLNDFKDNVAKGVASILNDILTTVEDLGTEMDKLSKRDKFGTGADGTGTNAAVSGPNINANYIQEWAKNNQSQQGYGFASLGIDPSDYYLGLSGGSRGDMNMGASQMGRVPYWMLSGESGFDFSKYVSTGPAGTSGEQYKMSDRTDEGDFLVRHPWMRGEGTSDHDNERGAFTSDRADDQRVAMDAMRAILHKTHDTFLDVEIAAKSMIKPFQDASDAYIKDQQRRANIQSVGDAFGLKKDGLYSEVGGGMSEALQGRRDQLEADLDKRYGKNSAKTKQGLDQFDQQAKLAMDQYALSTGQATKESLYFRDIQTSLNQRFRDGKISMEELTKQTLALAEAAKSGKTDINSLIDMNYAPQIKDAGRKAGGLRWEAQDEKQSAALEGKDGKLKDSVLAAMKKEANDAEAAVKAAQDAVALLPTTLSAHLPEAVKAFNPFASTVSGILTDIQTMADMSFNVQITTTSTRIGSGGSKTGMRQFN